MDLFPARELARVGVSRTGRHLERARDDRAAPLERQAQQLQPLRLEAELAANVLEARGAGLREVVEQPTPVPFLRVHALDLATADRVERRGHLVRDEQVLAAMNGNHRESAFGELAEPRPLRPGPFAEAAAAGLVCLLVTCLVEARQSGVGGSREEPSVTEERRGLVERLECAIRRQPA